MLTRAGVLGTNLFEYFVQTLFNNVTLAIRSDQGIDAFRMWLHYRSRNKERLLAISSLVSEMLFASPHNDGVEQVVHGDCKKKEIR
jgi:hypothetical protein